MQVYTLTCLLFVNCNAAIAVKFTQPFQVGLRVTKKKKKTWLRILSVGGFFLPDCHVFRVER